KQESLQKPSWCPVCRISTGQILFHQFHLLQFQSSDFLHVCQSLHNSFQFLHSSFPSTSSYYETFLGNHASTYRIAFWSSCRLTSLYEATAKRSLISLYISRNILGRSNGSLSRL